MGQKVGGELQVINARDGVLGTFPSAVDALRIHDQLVLSCGGIKVLRIIALLRRGVGGAVVVEDERVQNRRIILWRDLHGIVTGQPSRGNTEVAMLVAIMITGAVEECPQWPPRFAGPAAGNINPNSAWKIILCIFGVLLFPLFRWISVCHWSRWSTKRENCRNRRAGKHESEKFDDLCMPLALDGVTPLDHAPTMSAKRRMQDMGLMALNAVLRRRQLPDFRRACRSLRATKWRHGFLGKSNIYGVGSVCDESRNCTKGICPPMPTIMRPLVLYVKKSSDAGESGLMVGVRQRYMRELSFVEFRDVSVFRNNGE